MRPPKVILIGVPLFLTLTMASLSACATAPARDTKPTAASSDLSVTGSAKAPSPPGTSPESAASAQRNDYSTAANTRDTSATTFDRMIIRSATLSVIVKDVEAVLATARDVATTAGGFVSQSTSRYEGQLQVATITLQVPAEQFDATMAALRRQAAKVESENGNTQDVTEEFTDLDAQVRNLQATEAALQRLMETATRMEDIITLQRELTNVRGEIEKRQGRMKFLARRSDMATITLSIRPEATTAQQQIGWQPLEIAQRAWAASLAVLMSVAGVVIAVLVFAWWIAPLALLGLYLWRTRMRSQQGSATS